MENMAKASREAYITGVHKVSGQNTSDGLKPPNVGSVISKNAKREIIVDTYKINNKEYSISYTGETKAKDLFDCLNRIVINNNGMVTYKDICIRVKEPIIGVVAIEKRKGLGSWFTG